MMRPNVELMYAQILKSSKVMVSVLPVQIGREVKVLQIEFVKQTLVAQAIDY